MMMLATVLLVTADRSCCWFTAGDDDARADRPLAVGQGPNAPLQDRGADAGLTRETGVSAHSRRRCLLHKPHTAPSAPTKSP